MFEKFRKWFGGLVFVQNEHDKFASANKQYVQSRIAESKADEDVHANAPRTYGYTVPAEKLGRPAEEVKRQAEEARPSAYGFYKAAPTNQPADPRPARTPAHVHSQSCSHSNHVTRTVAPRTVTTTTVIEEDNYIDPFAQVLAAEILVEAIEEIFEPTVYVDTGSIFDGDDY